MAVGWLYDVSFDDSWRSFVVTTAELDTAIAAGKACWTWVRNLRPVRCVIEGCRRWLAAGGGRQLWVDGHVRGYICESCRWNQSIACTATRKVP